MPKHVLHCDLNNFYASVAVLLDPSLAGKPVAVCGDPKKRHGIVLAKSMPAKLKGVQTGEAIWQAQKKCPDLVLVAPQYDKYVYYSKKVREIYARYTDRIESFGIDECWLDVTGSTRLFGSPEKIAYEIKEAVKNEIGLTISVGVSFTKVFAKLGSDMKKPDAVTVISPENFKEKIWKLPASEMLYVGRRVAEKLAVLNIHTIGELANADRSLLRAHFGIVGDKMADSANGSGDEEVKRADEVRIPKSVGHGTTASRDVKNISEAKAIVFALSEMVATRLRKYGLDAGCVSVGIRQANMQSFTRQCTLPVPTHDSGEIAKAALKIIEANYNFKIPARTISVYTSKLSPIGESMQITLFDDEKADEKRDNLLKTIDDIREKYGYNTVKKAILLSGDDIAGNLHEDDDFLPFKKD